VAEADDVPEVRQEDVCLAVENKDQIERHPIRLAILEALQASPGLHHQELVRRMGKSNGTIQHHIHKLVKSGRLIRLAEPGFTCFFLKGTDPSVIRATSALKSSVAKALLDLWTQEPELGPVDAARRLGVAHGAIQYHAQRLRRAQLLPQRC
jgi:predicted transcriptional regulator